MLDDKRLEIERLAIELVRAVSSLESELEGAEIPEDEHYQMLAERIFNGEYMEGLLKRARGGISMRYHEDGEDWWACPSCTKTFMSEDESNRGKICDECSAGLLEDEVVRFHQLVMLTRIIGNLAASSSYPMFRGPVQEWLNKHLRAIERGEENVHIDAPNFHSALQALASSVESAGYSKSITVTMPNGTSQYIPIQGTYADAGDIIRRGY